MNKSNNNEKAEKQSPAQTAEEKLKALLSNWMNGEIRLAFHLRSGEVLKGKLLYFVKYEYVVQPEGDKAAVVILKHAVDYIDRGLDSKQIGFQRNQEQEEKEVLRRMKRE